MAKTFPLHPKYPHRLCWGCSQYCPATDLQCGNGSIRIQHPIEIDGAQWYLEGDWSGLLSAQQLRTIAAQKPTHNASKPRRSKPHIVLYRKK